MFQVWIKFVSVSLIGLTCAGAAHAGAIYKWVDSKGVVHYSQTMPKNMEAKSVNIRKSKSSAPIETSDEIKEMEESKPKGDPEKEKLQEQLKAERQAKRKQQCQALKTSLDNLAVGGRVYEMKDGERNYLSGDQIDERRIKVRDTYMKNCAGTQ